MLIDRQQRLAIEPIAILTSQIGATRAKAHNKTSAFVYNR